MTDKRDTKEREHLAHELEPAMLTFGPLLFQVLCRGDEPVCIDVHGAASNGDVVLGTAEMDVGDCVWRFHPHCEFATILRALRNCEFHDRDELKQAVAHAVGVANLGIIAKKENHAVTTGERNGL